MDIAKRSRNAEIRANRTQSRVDLENILGLSVEAGIVDSGVVYAVFLATSDADFHLEPQTDFRHTSKIFDTGGDVLLFWFLGKIEHVRGEERLLMLLVVLFVGFEHTVEPGKELMGAVIAVKDHGTEKETGQRHSRITAITYMPYAFATVRIWWAAAMAPVMEACCLSLARPLPAK